ncbi:MAG: hypothetical protein IPK74_34850 [Deltaproteobacteria bacterium]|nr:hypothetical protein [Deltaproteobacteria bacterium]
MRRSRGGAVWLALVVAMACGGKGGGAADAGKAGSHAEAKPDAGKAVAVDDKADANKPPLARPVQEPTPAPVDDAKAAAAADPLGQRFRDPDWFRKDMLEGATAQDVSRSERTDEGFFSSQILFELPAGTTAESCAEQLEKRVGGEVTNLQRGPDEKLPGRLKITGSTDRYRVTMMCGEAKGAMRAYVSYEWTK